MEQFWGPCGGRFGDRFWTLFWGGGVQEVAQLEALQAIATLCLADHIQDTVNEFGTPGVMSLYPVVACSGLPKDEVV